MEAFLKRNYDRVTTKFKNKEMRGKKKKPIL